MIAAPTFADRAALVLDLLAEAPDGMGFGQLRDRVPFHPAQLQEVLQQLLVREAIRRNRRRPTGGKEQVFWQIRL